MQRHHAVPSKEVALIDVIQVTQHRTLKEDAGQGATGKELPVRRGTATGIAGAVIERRSPGLVTNGERHVNLGVVIVKIVGVDST